MSSLNKKIPAAKNDLALDDDRAMGSLLVELTEEAQANVTGGNDDSGGAGCGSCGSCGSCGAAASPAAGDQVAGMGNGYCGCRCGCEGGGTKGGTERGCNNGPTGIA